MHGCGPIRKDAVNIVIGLESYPLRSCARPAVELHLAARLCAGGGEGGEGVTDLNLEIEADGLVTRLGHALEHGSTQVIRIVDCVAKSPVTGLTGIQANFIARPSPNKKGAALK